MKFAPVAHKANQRFAVVPRLYVFVVCGVTSEFTNPRIAKFVVVAEVNVALPDQRLVVVIPVAVAYPNVVLPVTVR